MDKIIKVDVECSQCGGHLCIVDIVFNTDQHLCIVETECIVCDNRENIEIEEEDLTEVVNEQTQ